MWFYSWHIHIQYPTITAGIVYLVELLLGDVWFVLSTERTESTLDLLTRLDVLCLAADHEGHILLQGNVAIPENTEMRS